MTHLKEGHPAPKFHLVDQNNNGWSLEDFHGKHVVLYFYPEDDTPGCTKEACAFRDNFEAFKQIKTKVIGVSPDTHEAHARFVDKYDLPFTLLADPTHEVAEEYGVWDDDREAVARQTFLIDPQGRIEKVYEKVDAANHAVQVLEDLRTIRTTT